ncbi:MAG TPA: xylanase [Balneolaceae bacterium]|nr:xylanase [Balneolaceae bacterium]|tara:strand:- start:613 stop:1470 length:858 start_codon:yes stop_codon:yes gene_type:complete
MLMSDKIVPLFLLMVLLACSADYPKEPFTAELWPERSAGIPDSVSFTTLPSRGDGVIRITDIKKPLITVYPAPGTWEPKPAVLIFPGGAYQYMAVNKEGSQIAEWFNRVGITGIVVRYTTPNDREAAFKDAVKALELVHAHASVWNIDPDRIGVIGFSAGGHLAARVSTNLTDRPDIQPDLSILIYPAYLSDDTYTRVAGELPVTPTMNPVFIVQTEDDRPYVESTQVFQNELLRQKVPVTFHLFPEGGHGYGMQAEATFEVSRWPVFLEEWLTDNGFGPRSMEE